MSLASEPNAPVRMADTFARLPPPWPDDSLAGAIRTAVRASGRKIVVLDDDPTGTQTVHGVNILTHWPLELLREELADPEPVLYILTNSRSVGRAAATALNEEIATRLAEASRATGRPFVVVSRSDSTLRGHYPAEIDALAATLERETGVRFDGHIVVPFFAEGGRFTIDDVHWVQDGELLVPAGETEYARDHTFGYRASNLRVWVAEKGGAAAPDAVVSISLALLREGGPQAVADALAAVRGQPVIVNCASYRDLEVFIMGLLLVEAAGRHFLVRSAAGFVKVRGGIADQPLLSAATLPRPPTQAGGLVVVGSYIAKSSGQLAALLALPDIVGVEMPVARVLDPAARDAAVDATARAADAALLSGQTAVVFSSRQLVTGASQDESLAIGAEVSRALTDVVQRIGAAPRFVVAKGGITSSDTATRGLHVERARVLGQIAPGVPVWQLGPESRLPGTPYIVFPGNVGGPDALAQVVTTLRT